jgi:hypothetical protein
MESDATLHIPVVRSGGSDGAVSVNYATGEGTARSGVHYQSRAGTLTFGPGELLKHIDVPMLDNAEYWGDVSFNVTLDNAAGAPISDPTLSVTIRENDDQPYLSVRSTTLSEGHLPEQQATVELELVGAPRGADTVVTWQWTSDNTQRLIATSGTLTIPKTATSAPLTLRWRGNTTLDADLVTSLYLTASNAGGTNATITIVDDDERTLSVADVVARESDKTVAVTIKLSRPSDNPIVFDVGCGDAQSTAENTSDYRCSFAQRTFPPSQVSAVVHIELIDDDLNEGEETFPVTAYSHDPDVARRMGTVTILADGDPRYPSLQFSDVFAGEGSTATFFAVLLDRPVSRPVTFNATTRSATAEAGKDFTPVRHIHDPGARESDHCVRADHRRQDRRGRRDVYIRDLQRRQCHASADIRPRDHCGQ